MPGTIPVAIGTKTKYTDVMPRNPDQDDLARWIQSWAEVQSGPRSGELMQLFPFQRRWLRGAMRVGITEASLSVARGNGKTSLIAAVIASVFSPDWDNRPIPLRKCEVILCASTFAQARVIAEEAELMIRSACVRMGRYCVANELFDGEMDIDEKRYKKRYEVRIGANRLTIRDTITQVTLIALATNVSGLHGRRPGLVLADELAQWRDGYGDKMIAALRTSLGKIENSRMFCISTKPSHPDHFFSKMLARQNGKESYSQLHTVPSDTPFEELGNRNIWKLANPAIAKFKSLERAIKAEWESAQDDPNLLAAFRAYRLNQGVSDTANKALIEVDTWLRIEGETERKGMQIWGMDLGSNQSMSAVAPFWPESGRLEMVAALPRNPTLDQRESKQNIPPGTLAEIARREELYLYGHQVCDVAKLMETALERFGKPNVIVCDRFRKNELIEVLNRIGFPSANVQYRGMGWRDGSEDVRLFRRAIGENRLVPVESLLARYSLSQAITQMDMSGNEKMVKRVNKLVTADDVACAAVLAVAEGERNRPYLKPASKTSDPGFVIV
ncbi:MAG: terminase large subunit [Candidatus Poribacteria bacterium]|nr:terminase large subunit [Candidatus Poribacteria bacterium]